MTSLSKGKFTPAPRLGFWGCDPQVLDADHTPSAFNGRHLYACHATDGHFCSSTKREVGDA
jgi:hypothetical protein